MKPEKFFLNISFALGISVPLWWLVGATFIDFRKIGYILMFICTVGAILSFILYLIFDTLNNYDK